MKKKILIYALAAAGCAIAISILDGCTGVAPVTLSLPATNVTVPIKGGGSATISIPAQTVTVPTPTPVPSPVKTSFVMPHPPHKVAIMFPTHPPKCA